MIDHMVIMKVPGKKLHNLLENGVSGWPMYEGKFPAISGIRLEFDPSKPSFERILKEEIFINGEILDYEKEYMVAAKRFIAGGKDGYTAFKDCEMLTGEDEGLVLVNEYMKNLKLLEEKKDSKELRDLLKIVNNEEAELSPEVEKDGEMVQFIMLKPKIDGRIKIKNKDHKVTI